MPAGVLITRGEYSALGLRRAARRTRDARAACRMLAIALVLEGRSRAEAAASCGMDRQTLRDWVHRYNADGLAGLSSRSPPGPASRLSAAQKAEVAEWVRRGPDPVRQRGLVRWRRRDLAAEILARFGVELAERTMSDLLRELNFSRISVRPHHPQRDVAAQETFKKTLPIW